MIWVRSIFICLFDLNLNLNYWICCLISNLAFANLHRVQFLFSDFCQRRPRGTSIEPPSWTLTMQSDYCVLECRYRNKIDGVIGFGVSTTIKNDFEIRIIIILCHRREWIEMNEKQNCSLSYLKNTFFIFIIISTIFIFTILANAIYV